MDSAILTVPHSTKIIVPVFVKFKDCDDLNSSFVSEADDVTDSDFLDISEISASSSTSTLPQLLCQSELNDLVCVLALPKISVKLLTFRLNERHLYPQTCITYDHKREETIVFCLNIEGLLLYLGAPSYYPFDWHLFLGSSRQSIKCVLSRNGNEYASVPIGHSIHANETYENLTQFLSLINYDNHKLVI